VVAQGAQDGRGSGPGLPSPPSPVSRHLPSGANGWSCPGRRGSPPRDRGDRRWFVGHLVTSAISMASGGQCAGHNGKRFGQRRGNVSPVWAPAGAMPAYEGIRTGKATLNVADTQRRGEVGRWLARG
jgi:hypothetical protein